jgi:DNA-directed RNA polymerase subunit RPC12/RpoP
MEMGQFSQCKACHNTTPFTKLYKCGDCGYRFCDDESCGPYEAHTFSASGNRCPKCSSLDSSEYGKIDCYDDEVWAEINRIERETPSERTNHHQASGSKFFASIVGLSVIWLLPFASFQAAMYFGFPAHEIPTAQQIIPVFNWLFLALVHVTNLLSSLTDSGNLASLLKGDACAILIGGICIGTVTFINESLVKTTTTR